MLGRKSSKDCWVWNSVTSKQDGIYSYLLFTVYQEGSMTDSCNSQKRDNYHKVMNGTQISAAAEQQNTDLTTSNTRMQWHVPRTVIQPSFGIQAKGKTYFIPHIFLQGQTSVLPSSCQSIFYYLSFEITFVAPSAQNHYWNCISHVLIWTLQDCHNLL